MPQGRHVLARTEDDVRQALEALGFRVPSTNAVLRVVYDAGHPGARSKPALLRETDKAALRVWLISRCAVLALTWPAVSILRGSAKSFEPWISVWLYWDSYRLQSIARYGYFGAQGHFIPDQVAFLPGFPIVLSVVHVLIRQWTAAGLLVSFVAGGLAVVALARICDNYYAPRAGRNAVLFLVTSPASVFLALGYTESLFLAMSLSCWLAVRRGRWTTAVWLAGLAAFTRVNGLFLCVAVLIEILRTGHGRRVRAIATFVPALLPLAGYEIYLWANTGNWLAWQHVETAGWQRQLTNPITAFETTWNAAFGHEFAAVGSFPFQVEILAALAGLAVTGMLLWRRRWAEAAYAGLTIAALATSIWYESIPRALLLLWPLWCGLAAISVRRPWIGHIYVALCVPVAVTIGLLYMNGSWAG
jgi:hypothetical protein